MKPSKPLGAIDEGGHPKELVYAIGAVIERGAILPSKRNHADYVDEFGQYDLVRYLEHHKNMFPAINVVGIG